MKKVMLIGILFCMARRPGLELSLKRSAKRKEGKEHPVYSPDAFLMDRMPRKNAHPAGYFILEVF